MCAIKRCSSPIELHFLRAGCCLTGEVHSFIGRGAPFLGSAAVLQERRSVFRGVRICLSKAQYVPVDETVRLLAGVVCPAGVTVCEDCVVMPGAVGTLSPSDSVGPVGHVGTLSPSDSDSVGTVALDGTLSYRPCRNTVPAVPAGIPFQVGPVGTLSPTVSDSVGPCGP